MLTDIQIEKAAELLGEDDSYIRLPMYRSKAEEQKKIAYNRHQIAKRMVEEYRLPYRIILDYLREHDTDYIYSCQPAVDEDGTVLLNRCYPSPGYVESLLTVVGTEDISIEQGPFDDDLMSGRYDLRFTIKDIEKSEKIRAKAAEQLTWGFDNPIRIKCWEFEFAHFLADADLDNYLVFDYFGTNSVPDGNQLMQITKWKKLKADYINNPEKYRTEEPTCDVPQIYTSWEFNWVDNSKTRG